MRRLFTVWLLLAFATSAPAADWALTGALGAHDPTIIKEGNTWWCFTTGTGLPVKFSTDGLNWQQGVPLFSAELSWWRTYASQMAHLDVWAPDVHYFGGRYWCYYCVSEFGNNNSAIGLESCTSIALGDWRDDGLVISSKNGVQTYNTIDPDLAIDASGNPWLVFGSYFDGIHVVPLDPATMKPNGALTTIAVRANGIEGSNIVHANGYYYLFVSIDQCCMGVNSTYKIAFGRSTSITGPYTDQSNAAMLSGGGTVLDSSGPRWKGPGGQSVYQNGNDWIIAFHAYDANNGGAPTLMISDLYWDATNWPTFAGPILPAFTTQPAGQTVTAGAPVTFTAAASGSPTPTFQWKKGGTNIGSATGSSYTIAVTTAGDAGTYSVVATNAAGSVPSSGAVLVVNPASSQPSFVSQPASQTVVAGNSAGFSATASGAPAPSYHWQRQPAGGSTWSNLADGGSYGGSGTTALTISGVIAAMSGDQFRCIASNTAGSANSAPATLAVRRRDIDFNGDGKSDLLWQNTLTGERSIWLMNGTSFASGISLGVVPTDWSVAGTGDFNGDGKTDLIWQNTVTGECTIWLMNDGTFLAGASLGLVPTDWSIAGTGDFNGDGQADILWQNTLTGERSIWVMNGTTFLTGFSFGIIPTDRSIAGVADFNADGKPDILWQNIVTGECSIWLMDGTNFVSEVSLGIVSPSLQIVGTGDYNSDGKPDIILTNTLTGERSVWLMDGPSIASTVTLATVPVEWVLDHPVPSPVVANSGGDFNGDGKSDLLWQNTVTGECAIWLMNGGSFMSGITVGVVPTDWSIAGTGDFNSDGKPDLLWQNTVSGERSIWLMNGGVFQSGISLGLVPTDWSIAGIADFNADGKPDLVWQNTSTGERSIWLMNGSSFMSGITIGIVPTDWSIAGTGDFNGDGKPDLIWQNTSTGERSIWLMNGGVFQSGISLGVFPTDWSIAGTGDFNGDGKPDLIWQNTSTGERAIWLMDGGTLLSGVSLGAIPTDWSIRN